MPDTDPASPTFFREEIPYRVQDDALFG